MALLITVGARLNGSYAPFTDTDQISGSVAAGFWIGDISITKDTDPNDDTNFDFTAAGGTISPTSFELEDDGDEGDGDVKLRTFSDLDAGVYTFVELAQSGYEITGISCNVVGSNGSTYAIQGVSDNATFEAGEDTIEVTLAGGDAVNCTFTNEPEPETGSITIIKDVADGIDDQDFVYTTSGAGLSGFSLDDDGNNGNALSNTEVFSSLLAGGSYSVTETVPSDFVITDISCTGATSSTITINGADDDGDFDPGDSSVTIILAADEDIICTFENTETVYPNIDGCLALMGVLIGDVTVIFGTNFGEVIAGGAVSGPLIIFGFDGDDTLNGNNTSECLVGGEGADKINGNNGNDFIFGGPGDDAKNGAAFALDGGAGGDFIDGGPGNDELDGGTGDDDLHGGPGDDDLFGAQDEDSLAGDGDTDICDGGTETDTTDGSCETVSNIP